MRCLLLAWAILGGIFSARAAQISTPYGTSYQVNVNAAGQNIGGDAANEPSMCKDLRIFIVCPANPESLFALHSLVTNKRIPQPINTRVVSRYEPLRERSRVAKVHQLGKSATQQPVTGSDQEATLARLR